MTPSLPDTPLKSAPNASLSRLNAVRIFVVLMITFGYASTMPIGPGNPEILRHFGYDPSWYGVQVLFFISGYLGLRSLERHGSIKLYLKSRALRNIPVLGVYTLATITVLYPIFCKPGGDLATEVVKLSKYFVETVSLIRPGQRLPGLLEDARYMCLIQGAIWTLRWGAVAHIGLCIGWHLKILQSKYALLAVCWLAIATYIAATLYSIGVQDFVFEPEIPGVRVGYAFLAGATVFAWKDSLPTRLRSHMLILLGLFSLAFCHFYFVTWTPLIEVFTSGFWAYLTLILILVPLRATNWLKNWPNLTAALYMSHWPITQILLLKFPETNPGEMVAMSLTCTVLIAWLTHFAITGRLNSIVTRLLSSNAKPVKANTP